MMEMSSQGSRRKLYRICLIGLPRRRVLFQSGEQRVPRGSATGEMHASHLVAS